MNGRWVPDLIAVMIYYSDRLIVLSSEVDGEVAVRIEHLSSLVLRSFVIADPS